MKKKIAYWSPHINSQVATVRAVLNSIKSIIKYSKNELDPEIINVFGEWDKIIKPENKIKLFNFSKLSFIKKIPSEGYICSRIKYFVIFIFSTSKLYDYLKKKKPDYLIIHLLTSIPIFLNIFFNFKTRIILRISGMPKLNFLRFIFWKISLKKIHLITFPTKETLENFKKLKIINEKKLILLKDPIIDTNFIIKIKKKIKEKKIQTTKISPYICIGRLTRQKNFQLIINSFYEISKYNKNFKVIILGSGEQFYFLDNLIKKYNLQNNIFLKGHKSNIYEYLKNAKCFISSSLWEDPGWVIVEAIYSNTFVISSNCPSGPKELLSHGGGYLFKNNSKEDLIKKILMFESLTNKEKIKMKIKAKKKISQYTLFRHFNSLKKIL
jgi:glycosyltransferase involved in cell wall biosynthesis